MKEINKQLPLGRYQSMVNLFAVVFEKCVFLCKNGILHMQEWYFAYFNRYLRFERCFD